MSNTNAMDTRKHSKTETLSYTIALDTGHNDKIITTLNLAKKAENYYLRRLYNEELLSLVSSSRLKGHTYLGVTLKAYKTLEGVVKQRRYYIPSRINRGLLEVVGRTLRVINDRKGLFELLRGIEPEPSRWDYRLLIEDRGIYKKSGYVDNLTEQVENFREPDDGQAMRWEVGDDEAKIELKVAKVKEPKRKDDWEWIDFSVKLPEIVKGKKGGVQVRVQNFEPIQPLLVSPDLRACLKSF